MTIVVPDHLRLAQLKASDPTSSIWVSANAGSGKTHVLTQRVIRLLLRNVPPAKILCLTFTKAAAAQMATRVFDTLAAWTDHDDTTLRAAIMETGAPSPTATDLKMARRLFTRTVETPGGLKIQTIHAFCERLLHLFPFEANVPARFEVADDARQAMLLAAAKRDAIAEAHRASGLLNDALRRVADEVSAGTIDTLIGDAMKLRAPARRWALTDPQSDLTRQLGLSGTDSVEPIERSMLDDGLASGDWPDITAFLATGTTTDIRRAEKLAEASRLYNAMSHGGRAQALDAYCGVFFTEKGDPGKSLMTKGLATRRPDLATVLSAEQTRLIGLRDRLRAVETADRTAALIALADLALRNYDDRKISSGILDFDDLIERTRALLNRSDAGWVLHKLDNGIDHVLVDEAQDTSATQWRILEELTGDFAVGLGARGADRSFFAVGDDKQSIFSFQGAAPQKFHTMRRRFASRFEAGLRPFDHVRLQTSFRSVPGILSAVDKVFEPVPHRSGLVQDTETWPGHDSVKARLPGLVEVWPPIGKREGDEPVDWRIPVDVADEQDPASVLATRIAATIATLVDPGSPERVYDGRGERPRPIRPGDVLILVRRRNAFFEAVIRAMKQAGVPVAGADRLDVANHIAVMDLVAAGRAALLPHDDLTLACLLKSPLFGFTDDDLIALAPRRTHPLIESLARSADPRHNAAHAKVLDWGRHAAEATPFAFYVTLLGRDGGRRRMEARLGPEAHDAIDEFLRLALAHERDSVPSLDSFLADVEALQTTIKRDMEGPGDAVRVMTVHAAKGLESKIVFLPDTCGVPSLRHEPTIFNLEPDDEQPPVLAWSPRKGGDCPALAKAREAAREATMKEYRRLLYVALTRAEERLYIAGFHGARTPDAQCWSLMIEAAFADDPTITRAPAPWDESEVILRRHMAGTLDASLAPSDVAVSRRPEPATMPEWLGHPAPHEAAAPEPLRPSQAEPLHAMADVTGTGASSLAYGSAIHALLQYLPSLPLERRESAALAYLRVRDAIPASRHADLVGQVQRVLALPELAPMLAEGSRTEVSVIGHLARPDRTTLEVRGTVDRLAVGGDTVMVVDYKSGRPQDDPAIADAYLTQMALYRRVLAPLWPDKRLCMMLLWTAAARLVTLDDETLERAAAAAIAA